MEKAPAGAGAGARRIQPPGRCRVLALAACAASAPVLAHAQASSFDDALTAQTRTDPQPVRVQIRASTVPRIDAQDSGFQSPRVDVSLMPADGRGLAPMLGVSGASPAPASAALQLLRPSMDIGLRWSHPVQSQHIDVTAWRRMNAPDDAYKLVQPSQPTYGARVELNLSPVRKTGFALDRGFIGMQLEGGARITIKRKDGHSMLYYRTAF
jgi:hypothetical protein